jgi:hypothetical protein
MNVADDTAGMTSQPTRVANDTSGESDNAAPGTPPATPSDPAAPGPSASKPAARWLLPAAIGLGVLLLIAVLVVGCVLWRIGARAGARADAGSRLGESCTQLEQRLNRLIPPGATRSAADRADAIRDEDTATGLLIAELDRLPERARSYRSLPADWHELVAARERYASDLDAGRQTGRPAFFVMTRTIDGTDRVERIIHRSPDSCHASVRRLAAPDL